MRKTLATGAVLAALAVTALLTGCPKGTARREAPAKECTKMGETCSIDEGKLGTCVEGTAACATPPCLVCQSQH